MFQTLKNVLHNKSSRSKLLFTLMVLILVRLGNQIPTYGVNTSYFTEIFKQNSAFGFFNALTGNSFGSLSLFALSITPYITASIIIQLLTIAIPSLEELSKDGKSGKEKIEKITYIVAGTLGYLQALGMAVGFGQSGLLKSFTWYNCLIVTLLWGSSALFVLFLGKQIDKKGIGNGISLILLFNILSSLPSDFSLLFERFCTGDVIAVNILAGIVIVTAFIAIFTFAIILNNSEKKIKVNYSKRVVGNKMSNAGNHVIPIKVCLAGVMPIIFASSIMSMPVLIAGFFDKEYTGVGGFILNCFNSGNWFNLSDFKYTLGYLIYIVLVFFFGIFYIAISFNTREISENIRKNGGMINGIRPGSPTVEFLDKEVKYISYIGIFGLLVIATIPMLVSGLFGLCSLSLGGTSIIIISSVILETKKKLETETFASRSAGRLITF